MSGSNMTKEEKDLLLQDLCAGLPYGVMAKFGDSNPSKITNITQGIDSDSWFVESESEFDGMTGEFDGMMCEINNVKPYLFPMSSMTKEQKKDIFHNGKFYIDRHNSLCRFPMYEDDYDFVTMEDCLEIFNKLNKYHFDYRGLIPMGLANDATGKNIY